MTEVSAKFIDEAEAPTDAVVALRQRWENVMGDRAQLKNRDNKNPQHPDVLEDKRLHDIQLDIEKSIANTPTHTAAGIAAKLQQLQRDDEGFDGMSSWRPVAFRTALAALGRGGMPTIEDPVLALKREWETRWQQYERESDSPDEIMWPLHDALNETAYEIFQTPATTLAGIAFKLVLWARQHITRGTQESADWSRPPVTDYPRDLDHLPVVSALHDLERMACTTTGADTPPTEDD